MRKVTCIQLQNTYKKGTAQFSTNHKKTGDNFNYFYRGFDDFFSAFVDKHSECRSLITTLDKMILLAVKPSRLDVSSTQLKRGFNFPFKFIY